MRIVAGKYKGRRLKAPRGLECRPTHDRIKEALFSSLGPRVKGALFGDLFAGTGSIGLEALSRGAGQIVFAEASFSRREIIEKNCLDHLFEEDKEKWSLYTDIRSVLEESKWNRAFDIVYYDPPYNYLENVVSYGSAEAFINGGLGLIKENGLFVLETPDFFLKVLKEKGLLPEKTRCYGKISLLYYSLEKEFPQSGNE